MTTNAADTNSELFTESNRTVSNQAAPEITYHWICSYPFAQSKLIVAPPSWCTAADAAQVAMSIFDADGELINEITLQFETPNVSVFEMEQYLEGCKLVQGFKQAHVEISASPGVAVTSRFVANEVGSFAAPLIELSEGDFQFLPVTFSDSRSNLAVLVNLGEEEAEVKCRLYSQKRKPEQDLRIPPRSTRIVALEVDFMEHAGVSSEQSAQVYLRIALRAGERLGVQLVEETQPSPRNRYFATIS